MNITVLKRGDLVSWMGDQHWIYGACQETDVGYFCDTHAATLLNRDELKSHCADGDHTIVRYCPKHGFEAPNLPAKGEA